MPEFLAATRQRRSLVLRGLALAPLLAASPAQAAEEDGFRLTANTRLRYEAIGGQARAGFNAADELVNLRTIVRAEYDTHPLKFVVEVWDSRAWGANPGTPLSTGEVNALEPVQAYVAADFGAALGKGTRLALQAGRFTLDLGGRRLVASDDYRNTTNGFTGLRADLTAPGGVKALAFYVLPQTRLPDDFTGMDHARIEWDKESFSQVLWAGLVSKRLNASAAPRAITAEVSFVHYGERDAPGRPTRNRSLNTAGLRAIADPRAGSWDWELEGMYQWGETATSLAAVAPLVPVSASFVHARLGYTFKAPWQPRFAAEFDRGSGDRPGGTYTRFDTLFGMRRADFSPAGLYNAATRTNLVAAGARLELTPSKRVDGLLTYHALWLASAADAFASTGVRDPAGNSGTFGGHQIDARVRYWLVPKRLRFEANGVLLFKGGFLRDAPNAIPERTTRYVSLNLSAFL